ncbi:MAG: hypothetical protein UW28_C0007G0004 [Parcubacteria group bacterium GW2011_GWA2_44_13]|nr:MAG: hypothetical protein UW28_C0007G0004 [Parcubacteria group bacterium GW2011_GWA2_44_13]
MGEVKEHDVRVMCYGCSGCWAKYTCYTCNVAIDTGQTFLDDKWGERKKNFLKDHPCEEVKDETRYRVVSYDD